MDRRMMAVFTGLVLLIAQLAGGFSSVTASASMPLNPGLQAVVDGNSTFAINLYKKISETGPDNNVFFSPFSISTALSMTYAGARENTAKQMAATMNFRLPQCDLHPAFAELSAALKHGNTGYRLEIANALWGQRGYAFQPDFLTLVKSYYDGGFNTVDFITQTEASRGTINQWVESNTAGKIKDLLKEGSLTANTRLVLTNAIYFKGDWAAKFKPELTKQAPFSIRPGDTVDVPMMRQSGHFRYGELDGTKILEMPYVGGDLSMVVLLPQGSTADFEKVLDSNRLNMMLAKTSEQEVDVSLPKFKFEAEYQLKDLLQEMGMVDAFELPPADFSGISGKKDLFITKVIHKAVIEVNEEGSEAAAATAVIVGTKSMPFKPEFKADRPFLFLIRHNATGSILFLGRVAKP